jgi:hypothetical protein
MARARDAPEPPPAPAVRGEEGRGLGCEGEARSEAPGDVGTKRPGKCTVEWTYSETVMI